MSRQMLLEGVSIGQGQTTVRTASRSTHLTVRQLMLGKYCRRWEDFVTDQTLVLATARIVCDLHVVLELIPVFPKKRKRCVIILGTNGSKG